MECNYRLVKEEYPNNSIYYVERHMKIFGISLGFARVSRTRFNEADAIEDMEALCDEHFYLYRTINYKENNII